MTADFSFFPPVFPYSPRLTGFPGGIHEAGFPESGVRAASHLPGAFSDFPGLGF